MAKPTRFEIAGAMALPPSVPFVVRMMIPLKDGEEAPRYALEDAPEGYRWESDAELRERLKAALNG